MESSLSDHCYGHNFQSIVTKLCTLVKASFGAKELKPKSFGVRIS